MASIDRLLKNLNKIVREDKYIQGLLNASGVEIDGLEQLLQKLYRNFWFDTMDEDLGIPIVSKQLKIKLNENTTVEEKRSILEARWKSSGKSDVFLLQSVCDSWKNGEIEVGFENGHITIKFTSLLGIPTDLDSLKDQIKKAKPAHLLVDYLFKYLTIGDVQNMTIEELEQQTLDRFVF
ncbi:MAG: DUF2313 domain-containing protein [Firmicutes bacterium]|nr:DUF2313 domain-containing protein [Bacillota bacterium]